MPTDSRVDPKAPMNSRVEDRERQLRKTPKERQSRDGSPTGRDENLIGAERYPRKGDEEEESE